MRRFLVAKDAPGQDSTCTPPPRPPKQARIDPSDLRKVVILPKLHADSAELLRIKALLQQHQQAQPSGEENTPAASQQCSTNDAGGEQQALEALRQLSCYILTARCDRTCCLQSFFGFSRQVSGPWMLACDPVIAAPWWHANQPA